MSPPSRSRKLFDLLLRILPVDFREEYSQEMRSVFLEGHRESGASRGNRLRFWWRTVTGLFRIAPAEQLDSLRLDGRYALRMMRRRPLLTLMAIVSMAIGVAATTTLVSVVDALFLQPIPGVPRSDRLVNVKPMNPSDETFGLIPYPDYARLRDDSRQRMDLAGFSGLSVSLTLARQAEPELVAGQVVTWNYFRTLGVSPRLGRFFDPAEDGGAGSGPVTVISSWLWRERFGQDPAAIGERVWINGSPFTIIGVGPEGFRGHFIGFGFDLFIPSSMARVAGLPPRADDRAAWVELVARLEPGVSAMQAAEALRRGADRLSDEFPDRYRGLEIEVEATTGIDADLRGGLSIFLVILSGVSSFVLVIACMNVANMLLTRVASRRKEIAVRLALGASRGRLVRQMLTESLVLAVGAGTLGCLLAVWGASLARSAFHAVDPRVALEVRLDAIPLGASLVITLLAALMCGLAPATSASRGDLAAVMKHSSGQVLSRSRLWGVLVVAQVALSVVVLICAGLFLRAVQNATSIDPGFDPEGVRVVVLDPALGGMQDAAGRELIFESLERVRSLPMTQAACLISRVPLGLGARFFPNLAPVKIPGMQPPPGREDFPIEHALVSEGYFETLRIPVIEGRGFDSADREGAQPVAVVNRSFADRYFPSGGAVGRSVNLADRETRIVGVVRDSKYRTLEEGSLPFLYLPIAQHFPGRAVLLARSQGAGGGFDDAVRGTIRGLAPHLPVRGTEEMKKRLSVSLLPHRIAGGVAGGLGSIGLLLTALGLYGIVVHSVVRRASEIGLRMSLGATPASISRLVIRQGMKLTLSGIALGLPLAFLAGRLLSSMLVGLSPLDPITYAAIPGLLVATSALASYVPARRAAHVDPVSVLGSD